MENLDSLQKAIDSNIYKVKNLSLLRDIIDSYNGKDWQDKCIFSNSKYERIKIFANEKFEIYLICWQPNQESPIHDHPEQGCILKVLAGNLTEERYTVEPISLMKKINIAAGKASYIDNNIAYHKISNLSNKNAVSLHIYSPPEYQQKTL